MFNQATHFVIIVNPNAPYPAKHKMGEALPGDQDEGRGERRGVRGSSHHGRRRAGESVSGRASGGGRRNTSHSTLYRAVFKKRTGNSVYGAFCSHALFCTALAEVCGAPNPGKLKINTGSPP